MAKQRNVITGVTTSEKVNLQYIHNLESYIVEQEQLISGLKLKEAELNLKNDQLLNVISEKDKFFTIIAHDLRNPLQSLRGFIQIMHEELETLTIDDLKEITMHIRSSANKFSDLLENLMLWARMQRGLTHFNPEVVNLLTVIQESISRMSEAALNKGIELTHNVPDKSEVFVDVNILHTIFRNLISNAVKFTHTGGKLCLSAKPSGEKYVEISIEDNGIGMNPEIMKGLFKLDPGPSRDGSEGEHGTGLGLIICKDFIENQNGKFWVESEEGKGTVFHFTLPVNNLI